MKKLPKNIVNSLIIVITVVAAVYYFNKHTYLLKDIAHINPLTGLLVLGLYMVMLFVLVLVFTATMNLVNFKFKLKENILLNSYSIFINFFVPGQAGTAYRAYYLKKNHNLKVADYTVSTLIYYLIYGLMAVEMMIVGSQKWWISILTLIVMIAAGFIVYKIYIAKFAKSQVKYRLSSLLYIILATLVQGLLQILIYFVEIHSVNHTVRLDQSITYTGAADLALFVALTPAAIGIRESFLILSEKLHHVSTANILLANIIDRSVFILFLLLIGIVILYLKVGKHIRNFNFSPKQVKKYGLDQ